MSKVSVLIPSRNERFLSQTVEDILRNASGDIEVIVTLDGAPAVIPLPNDKRVITIRNAAPMGNVHGVNRMVQVATGQYIMKLDAHCMLSPGFDEELQKNCEYEWLSVPSRYQLLAEEWKTGRGPIDYLYLTYPYLCEDQFGWGLHGKKWLGEDGLTGGYFYRDKRDAHIKIDDAMTFQGSCWFMHKQRFLDIGGYDVYFYHFQEPQAIGMKVWLSNNGRCIRDKNVWYAHLHKGKQYGRGYTLSKHKAIEDELYSADFWMHDKWTGRTRDMHWFFNHFNGIPGWPVDWDDPKYEQEYLKAREAAR
jgi:glycosyltransferase involved in cell wall biosynthesis